MRSRPRPRARRSSCSAAPPSGFATPLLPRTIWSTYLAGERLIKLVEAGWAPVSVVGALASIRILAGMLEPSL